MRKKPNDIPERLKERKLEFGPASGRANVISQGEWRGFHSRKC